jgi:hypothetical protein
VCDAFGVGDVEFLEAAPTGAFESPEAAGSVPGIPVRIVVIALCALAIWYPTVLLARSVADGSGQTRTDQGPGRRQGALIVNAPSVTPKSTPRPVPLTAREISPFVITLAAVEQVAPACASPAT